MPALIGYARVSTADQNMALQLDALVGVVCLRVFSDRMSSTVSHRPGLADALSHLRQGDTLVVWKLDRIGRHMKGLVEILADLDARGVKFRSLTEGIDTDTPAGRLFFHMVAAFAQMERELIVERTHAGLAAARAQGRRGGRRPLMGERKREAARKLFASGLHVAEVAQTIGVSVRTLYRALPPEARQVDAFVAAEASTTHRGDALNGGADRFATLDNSKSSGDLSER